MDQNKTTPPIMALRLIGDRLSNQVDTIQCHKDASQDKPPFVCPTYPSPHRLPLYELTKKLGTFSYLLKCSVPSRGYLIQFRFLVSIARIVAADNQDAVLGHLLNKQGLHDLVLEPDAVKLD